MEEDVLTQIKKYEYVKSRMIEYRNGANNAMNNLNNTITKLNQNKDSVCINSYINTLKGIVNNINFNKNRINNVIIPSIEAKITELKMQI